MRFGLVGFTTSGFRTPCGRKNPSSRGDHTADAASAVTSRMILVGLRQIKTDVSQISARAGMVSSGPAAIAIKLGRGTVKYVRFLNFDSLFNRSSSTFRDMSFQVAPLSPEETDVCGSQHSLKRATCRA